MLYLYTHPPFAISRVKHALRKALKRTRGPDAVVTSLVRGLTELHVPFFLNRTPRGERHAIAHVVAGVDTLRWALRQKAAGRFTKVFAGPNIVVMPDEGNGIVQDKALDGLLLPSRWVKDVFIRSCPQLKERLNVWPAGVHIPDTVRTPRTIDVLVLNKRADRRYLVRLEQELQRSGLSFRTITYGTFGQQTYHELLTKSRALIYIGGTESQGLALQEAWAYDVPTFVREEKVFRYKDVVWRTASAAPYLHRSAGLFFRQDRPVDLKRLMSLRFSPRKYCAARLSDIMTTKLFLKLIGYRP